MNRSMFGVGSAAIPPRSGISGPSRHCGDPVRPCRCPRHAAQRVRPAAGAGRLGPGHRRVETDRRRAVASGQAERHVLPGRLDPRPGEQPCRRHDAQPVGDAAQRQLDDHRAGAEGTVDGRRRSPSRRDEHPEPRPPQPRSQHAVHGCRRPRHRVLPERRRQRDAGDRLRRHGARRRTRPAACRSPTAKRRRRSRARPRFCAPSCGLGTPSCGRSITRRSSTSARTSFPPAPVGRGWSGARPRPMQGATSRGRCRLSKMRPRMCASRAFSPIARISTSPSAASTRPAPTSTARLRSRQTIPAR